MHDTYHLHRIVFLSTLACVTCPAFAEAQSSDGDASSEGSQSDLDSEVRQLEREVTDEEGESDDSDDETDESNSSVEAELDQLESEVTGESSNEADDATAESDTSGSDTSGGGAVQSLNPDLSAILDTGFAWHAREPTLPGGPDPKQFGFFLQGLELALQAEVDPYFTFEAHLIAKLDGLKVGEAYATTLQLPADLQVRVGKFKTRFGRVNPFHLHAWHFVTLPLVNGAFLGPAGLNGLGLEVSQLLPLPWYAEWVIAAQELSSPSTGASFLREPGRVEGFDDLVGSTRLEQFFSLSSDWSLMWGLNYVVGRHDLAPNEAASARTDLAGTDLFIKWRAPRRRTEVGWQTEVTYRRRELPEDALTDFGGYSYLYVRPVSLWEIGGRYGYLGVTDGPDGTFRSTRDEPRHRAELALSHLPTEFSRLRLQYGVDDLSSPPDRWNHMIFLQAQFVTGAHGAHEF